MKRKGTVDLPLHYGKAPRWLFTKMVSLSRALSEIIIHDFGRDYLLEKLSDPLWFQCFGCVLGFDWHSSGLTTTVCGALKEAFRDLDYGIFVCGGKGATSRKTPHEIEVIGERLASDLTDLIHCSKMVAKVDNNALQDGFNLYHHSFIFTTDFTWSVVQQGMGEGKWARRYHWHSGCLSSFVKEPHAAIASDRNYLTLNMVDGDRDALRELSCELSQRRGEENVKDVCALKEERAKLPARHRVLIDDVNPKYLDKIFLKTYQEKPKDFEQLLALGGVGAKTIRALALVADLIYGEHVSFRDPARFSFAHGGKDGYPYHIDLNHYQKTIDVLNQAVTKAKFGHTDKVKALRRLQHFYNVKEGV